MTGQQMLVASLSRYEEGSAEERRALVASVADACTEVGFFLLKDHGVEAESLHAIKRVSAAFFDSEYRYKVSFHRLDRSRGYIPVGVESIGATAGVITPSDLKEAFGVAAIDVQRKGDHHTVGGVPPISWPDHPPGFTAAWRAYYLVMQDLSVRIMRLLADALGVAPRFLSGMTAEPTDFLRVINYPPQLTPAAPGQLRAGAHTDFGLLTILAADDVPGGLEVCCRDGSWRSVPHVPGTFTINIGDLMSYWTYGAWVSAVHRVANPDRKVAGTARRQSVVFFHNPNLDTVVDPLASFRPAGLPASAPVRAGDWLRSKTARQRLTPPVAYADQQ